MNKIDENCLFCKIAEHKLPSNIEKESETIIAFRDINPKAPVHILIIPKKHLASLNEVSEDDRTLLGDMLLMAKEIAEKNGLKDRGYRLILNTGKDGGQLVGHLHLHLLGGKPLGPKLVI